MSPYKIEYFKTDKTAIETIIIGGELSVNHIFDIRDELNFHLNSSSAYEILITDADIIDLSFIQLLISIKKFNPFVVVKFQINQEQTELLKVSGFYSLLNN
jgi:hypothetical protein